MHKTYMKFGLALALGLTLATAASPAAAVTVTFSSAPATDGSNLTSVYASQPGFTVVDFGSTACGSTVGVVGGLPFTQSGVTYSGSGNRACGSLSGNYATPSGDSTVYLTVPDTAVGRSGAVGVSFASGMGPLNYFGLYWGSIDSYNSVTLLNAGNTIATITLNPSEPGLTRNRYVNILLDDGTTYDSIQLNSSSVAFESDNHVFGYVSVPEPGTVALFAAGLAGLLLIRRPRRQASELTAVADAHFSLGTAAG